MKNFRTFVPQIFLKWPVNFVFTKCGGAARLPMLCAIVRRRAFSDQAFLKNDNLFTGTCQCKRRGQSSKTASENQDFGMALQAVGGAAVVGRSCHQ